MRPPLMNIKQQTNSVHCSDLANTSNEDITYFVIGSKSTDRRPNVIKVFTYIYLSDIFSFFIVLTYKYENPLRIKSTSK